MHRSRKQIAALARKIIKAGLDSASSRSGRQRIEAMRVHTHGYAEPGYQDAVVVTGDFNPVGRWEEVPMRWIEKDDSPKRVSALLGRAGVEIEWCDEWIACDWCSKIVRTEASGCSWKPSFWRHTLGVLCHKCVKRDSTEYLRHLQGRETAAETLGVDLEQHGYVLVKEGYEHGLHGGQDADPKLVAEALRRQGITRFVFRLDKAGQFDCAFSVHVHTSEIENLDRTTFDATMTDGRSVSEGLRQALADANQKMGVKADGHVKVATCDVISGTAIVRSLSPQEFIEGRAMRGH